MGISIRNLSLYENGRGKILKFISADIYTHVTNAPKIAKSPANAGAPEPAAGRAGAGVGGASAVA